MNDHIPGTTYAGMIAPRTGMLADQPEVPREPAQARPRARTPSGDPIPPGYRWSQGLAEIIADTMTPTEEAAMLRSRQVAESERARREAAEYLAQAPDRAYRTFRETYAVPPTPEKWIEDGGEGLTADECIEALRSEVKSLGTRLMEQGWEIERQKNALAELKPKPHGSVTTLGRPKGAA